MGPLSRGHMIPRNKLENFSFLFYKIYCSGILQDILSEITPLSHSFVNMVL